MSDDLGLHPAQQVEWEFQVEQQGFVTRYGKAGGLYFKQRVLGGKTIIYPYPVKVISQRVYETVQRISTALK